MYYNNDLTVTLEIIYEFRETYLEMPIGPAADSDILYIAQKSAAVDDLIEYIQDNIDIGPISDIIERYIALIDAEYHNFPYDSEVHDVLRIRKETAQEILIYFL